MLSLFTYIPLLGSIIGLNNSQIAISALFYGVAVFCSNLFIGRISDRIGRRKPFIFIGLFITSASVLSLMFPHDFFQFIFVRALVGVGFGIFIPTLTALIHEKGMKLGRFSSVGTAAWAVGIIISGFLGIFYIEFIFLFNSIVLLGAGLVAISVREQSYSKKRYRDSTLKVFWERKRILIAFTLRHSFAVSIWTLWPIYLLTLGADTLWIAMIQVLNPITASLLMKKYTDIFDSKMMVNLGLLLSSLTFFTYLFATDVITVLPSQIILGFSWAFLSVGTLRYAIEYSDYDKSTVSGWINSIQSISVIFGSIIAFIITGLGGSIPQIIFVAGIGTFIVFIFNFSWDFRLQRARQATIAD
jgi:MFS family permease